MNHVTIIMPVYNVEAYLPRAIDSVLGQTSLDWELILVDDGSTDKSSEICAKYAEKYPERITAIHQNNQGSGAARNTGLEKASGDYIYFADADDYLKFTLVEENLALLRNSEAEMLVFGYIEEKHAINEEYLPLIPQLTDQEMFRNHFRNFHSISPYALWNKMYKRSYLLENDIRFGDEKLGQDAVFNMKVFKNLSTISVNRNTYYHYLSHDESSVNKYREDRFELEYNIAEYMEKLLIGWGRQEEFYDLIQENYWDALYCGLAMASHPDNPLTKKEKYHRVERQLNDEKIQFYLDEEFVEREENPFRKQLLKFLMKHKIKRAMKLMKFRNQFANQFSTLFGWLRKPVI